MSEIKDREFNANPHYSPELCGLKLIDSLEKEPDYDFDMVVVWQDLETQKYYFDSDSGCSCPSPFEDVRRLSDLTELNAETFHNFKEACENLYSCDKGDIQRFVSKFRRKIK